MSPGLLGRKVGMTQVYGESGEVIPVTVIQAGPCHVLRLLTVERDGYEAVQVGYLDKPRRLASRADRGQVATLESKRQKRRVAGGASSSAKADCEPKRFIREFRGSVEGLSVGQTLDVAQFAEVKAVDVVSTSKGRGTAGTMKRHNFRGQRASHGVKKCHRHVGSSGSSAFPSRVIKGKRMAGRYGCARCTIRNLKVIQVDKDNHLLVLCGAVPGPAGGLVVIRQTNKVG